jgi:dTDP-glucose 4,6-dehydratase
MHLLVTGGAGFIGSNFIRWMLKRRKSVKVTNLDKLTYAGNLMNLEDVKKDPRYRFFKGDICDPGIVDRLAREVDVIVNFAAESHVDRSILSSSEFIETDIRGTMVLLEAAKKYKHRRYLQISTDEVYGSILKGSYQETDSLSPSSPYAASKASADLMVLAYRTTFGLPVLISRCSNNYGPYQYPEKLIPLFVTNAVDDKALPLYGDGKNVRDWIFVLDHCAALDRILEKGRPGEIYNIGAGQERRNIDVAYGILKILGKPASLIQRVKDRPGHDRRYAISSVKLGKLGFRPKSRFEEGLLQTVLWYRNNPNWWRPIKDGDFKNYYKDAYGIS